MHFGVSVLHTYDIPNKNKNINDLQVKAFKHLLNTYMSQV